MFLSEFAYRKQKKIPSNILSLITALLLVFAIKVYAIDLTKMSTDALAPTIRKNEVVLFQPAFFTIKEGDVVIYKSEKDKKPYVSKVQSIVDNKIELLILSSKETIIATRKDLSGKVINF